MPICSHGMMSIPFNSPVVNSKRLSEFSQPGDVSLMKRLLSFSLFITMVTLTLALREFSNVKEKEYRETYNAIFRSALFLTQKQNSLKSKLLFGVELQRSHSNLTKVGI